MIDTAFFLSKEKENYSIHVSSRYVEVKGSPIPLDQVSAIVAFANKLKFRIMDVGIAQARGAIFFFTSKKFSKEIRDEVDAKLAAEETNAELRWLNGYDTGKSSLTIFETMTGRPCQSQGEHPHDIDDFARCFRLLELFPQWRARMNEIPKKFKKSKEWKALVKQWSFLESLYSGVGDSGVRAVEMTRTIEQIITVAKYGKVRPL